MLKRGQIALFIIFGVVILIAVSFLFYIKSIRTTDSEIQEVSELPFNVAPIKSYVESCMERVSKEAILVIGKQGGYFKLPPTPRFEDIDIALPYYFYQGLNLAPSLKTIEEELSDFIDSELHFCVENLTFAGFTVKVNGKPNTTAIIRKDSVLFKVNYPLVFKKEEYISKVEEFSVGIDKVRLKTLHESITKIIDKQTENPYGICLSCILNITTIDGFNFYIDKVLNDTVVLVLQDNNSKIDNLPYEFVFANKYEQFSCTNLPPDVDYSFLSFCIEKEIEEISYKLELKNIPNFSLKANEEFIYDINASGINLVFSDYTELFDINEKTGLINFTPKEEAIGNHSVWVSVKDTLGNEDYETFQLNITNSS